MNDRVAILAAVIMSLIPLAGRSQDVGRVYRIGVLTELSQKQVDPWRDILRNHGYIEGQNATFTFRTADEHFDRLPKLASDLVEEKVDVILTLSTPPAIAAKNATTTIPIVTITADPIGTGLAASIARPGGNVTGLFLPLADLSSKRLQLLKEIAPGITSVALLWNRNNPLARLQAEAAKAAAQSLGIKIYSVEVGSQSDLPHVFEILAARHPGGLVVMQDPLTFSLRRQLAEFAIQNRLPASYAYREFVDEGGLMSYGFSRPGLFEAVAGYADKILKGARPQDLPFEQPTRVELVINLKAAKALRLRIPESILLRADEIVR